MEFGFLTLNPAVRKVTTGQQRGKNWNIVAANLFSE
jgi:hypothetical protein